MSRLLPASLLTLLVLLGLSACSVADSAAAPEAMVEPGANTIILDVRSQGEYAQGHLEGAVVLDFNSGEVAAALPQLDPDAEYLVYCRSGNRSGQAVARMQQAGFTNLTNLGSLEQASAATGLPIVR